MRRLVVRVVVTRGYAVPGTDGDPNVIVFGIARAI